MMTDRKRDVIIPFNIRGLQLRKVSRSKPYKKFKKAYGTLIILSLMFASTAVSGLYLGMVAFNDNRPVAVSQVADATNLPNNGVLLNGLMDETVSACYFETYQNPDGVTIGSGNVCNHAMIFFKDFCQTENLEACNTEFFKKYLAGMGE